MNNAKANTKNGKVEFLRLVFCLCVLGLHISSGLGVETKKFLGGLSFVNCRLGVEFFFLLSGYLLAASARKIYAGEGPLHIGRETFRFTLRKINAVLPVHLLVFPLTLVLRIFYTNFHSIQQAFTWLIRTVPNFFLLYRTGLDEVSVLGEEWYISKMLLAGFILFPLLLKYKKNFARIVCPLLTLLLVDYMMYTTGTLGGTHTLALGDSVSKMTLRALASMSLGIFCYEVVGYLKKCRLDRRGIRIAATVLEALLYLFCLFFAFSGNNTFEPYFLFFAAAGLTISFSEVSFGKTLFNRRLFYFAGEMSLPLYLTQRVVINLFTKFGLLGSMANRWQFVILFLVTVALALLVRLAARGIMRLIRRAGYAILPEEDAKAVLR